MPASNMTVLSPRVTHTHERPTSCPAPKHTTYNLLVLKTPSGSQLFPSSIIIKWPIPSPAWIVVVRKEKGSFSMRKQVIFCRVLSVKMIARQINFIKQMIDYVLPEMQDNFKMFKYSGGNDSITYQYLWSPLADRIVTFIPRHIAPNAITTTSLVILSLAHLLFMSEHSAHGVADWRLVLMAVSIFLYQNLDNLDGKQARRTNSSSPLGMLFDHGTDAVSAFLISLQVIAFLEVQDPFVRVTIIFAFVMLVYFSAMWAQYSTGHFRLGRVNPVDEGLPGYAIAAVGNIFLPEGFWLRETAVGPYNYCLLYGLGVLLVLIIYYMVKDNYKNAVRSHSDITRALLLPLSYAFALLLLKLVRPEAFVEAYLPLCYLLMFTWSRNMIEIQVYFVTGQVFNPFNLGTLTFLASTSLLFLPLPISAIAWTGVILAGGVFFEFVVSVLRQGSRILGIYVFSLEKREKQE